MPLRLEIQANPMIQSNTPATDTSKSSAYIDTSKSLIAYRQQILRLLIPPNPWTTGICKSLGYWYPQILELLIPANLWVPTASKSSGSWHEQMLRLLKTANPRININKSTSWWFPGTYFVLPLDLTGSILLYKNSIQYIQHDCVLRMHRKIRLFKGIL
jgi:hypothetical protein